MTRPSPTKIIFALAALFFLGGVCGYAVSHRQTGDRWAGERQLAWEDRWVEQREREDIERLKLTPEQIAQTRPAYDRLLADVRKVREQTARGIFRAVSAHRQTLSEQLTPEQRQEFQKLSEERRARTPRAK
jgi:Spy/CpxP family protein refolding chaperone